MQTPILGSSYVARSVNAANSRMVNLFPEVTPDGGKNAAWLSRAPGLTLALQMPQGPIRGLWVAQGNLYVAAGTGLYKVTPAYAITYLGNLSGFGPVSMSDNGFQLWVACNPDAFVYNFKTGVFQSMTDPNFSGAVTVAFIDGYFIYNVPNTQQMYSTKLYDGLTLDPLAFASAEGNPDNIVGLVADHRELWIFGSNSIEVWYDAGQLGFPLLPIQGAFVEIGCLATYSIAKADNGIFWLGTDARGNGIVYRNRGYGALRISTHAVEWQIQQYPNLADVTGYTYQQDGHTFYILNFPEANVSWVYDVATEAWHERAAWVNGKFDRHRGDCHANFNGYPLVGDYQNGNIYLFDLRNYTDNGQVQRWLRSWRALPPGTNNLMRTAHHSLQIDCEAGVGLSGNTTEVDVVLATQTGAQVVTDTGNAVLIYSTLAVQGADPKISLRWSDDGGHVWSNLHDRSMGPIGETGTRVIWRRLGMTDRLRDRVYEITGSDAVKIAIMGAELSATPTNA